MNSYEITFNTWNKAAELYQQHFMHLDIYNDTYDLFCCKLQTANPSILEIGCGPGNITKYLLQKNPLLQIDATDVSPNMIALAKQNNPAANCILMDAREIKQLTKTYNGIMCGFCLPYLSKEDCIQLFASCFALLTKGGVFYCSTIEGNYEQSGFETGSTGDKAYVYYYEVSWLEKQLQHAGFTNVQFTKKRYTKKDGRDETHLVLIGGKE